ncbi:MAG: RIP metalloprotease RseP [Anaerovoracaceae bacterium]
MTAVYAVLLFCILIFPHELGHFVAAKSVGVRVNEFALGMGPAIFKKQKGETLYALRIIPIGGYCAMEGENEESGDSRAFNNKPFWAKLIVLVAGSAMNVLITILTLSILVGIAGVGTTVIDVVTPGSPAAEAGIRQGDKISAINGKEIDSWGDLSTKITENKKGDVLEIAINRDGSNHVVLATPEKSEDGRYLIGIKPVIKHNPFVAVASGTKVTWSMTKMMFGGLKQIIMGEASKDDISGPVGIINLVSDTNQYGMGYFGYLVALISLNLAIINMLPLPALDGGRILFVFIRKATGKMISDDLEGKIHGFGMIMLIGLMLFITWNDITRLFL